MKYIDIHSHLNLEPLYSVRSEVITRMREKGTQTVVVGVDWETSCKAVDLSCEFPDVCIGATIGQHPNDNPEEVFEYQKFLELAVSSCVIGIGECGLDYYRLTGNTEDKEKEIERQKKLLRTHVRLATETTLPLMIHARPSKDSRSDAYIDVLDILEEEKFLGNVNFHFYVGDVETTRRIIAKGYSMSFDGPITFTQEYDEIIRIIPLEQIMCETDAPFAAPVPHRGKICEPWMVIEVLKKIATLKELSIEEANEQILKNSHVYLK
jgi:TatD DNase family protein